MAHQRAAVERYLWRADRYVQNVSALLGRNEVDKAGECLWGAVALALKAVALNLTRKRLQSHESLRAFAQELARSQRSPDLLAYFDSAEVLHRSFYEAEHTRNDVEARLDALRPFLHRLFALARMPTP